MVECKRGENMSKNLGPVHYMMYEKIKFQDEVTSFLMDGNTEKIDAKIPPVSKNPLDEIIDQDNIHGFLSSKIDVVENRLNMAFAMADKIDEKLYELGKKKASEKNFSSLEEVFQDLNTYLLDGMPCDNALSAMMDDEGSLFLVTNENLHKKYENFINPEASLDAECGGGHGHDHHDSFDIKEDEDINLKEEDSFYHKKRLEFLKGYFEESPYQVDLVNGINYKIYKK